MARITDHPDMTLTVDHGHQGYYLAAVIKGITYKMCMSMEAICCQGNHSTVNQSHNNDGLHKYLIHSN